MDAAKPTGKLNRGMSVVDTVEILKGRELEEGEYEKAAILGWCVELVGDFSTRQDSNTKQRSRPLCSSRQLIALASSILPRCRCVPLASIQGSD
jgi:hypothetical protein